MKAGFTSKFLACCLYLMQCFSMSQMSAKNSSTSNDDIVGAVYVATNDQVVNGVLMFHRHRDGTLTPVTGSPFLTGGQGTGTGFELPPDPIGSQGSLIVDKKNKFLFVVNSGSNEISSFKIHRNSLELISTVPSGGIFPNSLTVHDNLVYAINSANTFTIAGFTVDKHGKLTPLCKSCQLLAPVNQAPIIGNSQPTITVVPGQIGFSPNGKQLVVIRKEGVIVGDPFAPLAGPGRIDIYNVDKCGHLKNCYPTSNINTRSPNGRFPFSFVFSKEGHLLVTEIAGVPGTPPNSIIAASAASSYKLLSNGTLELISASVPNGASAMCWNAISGRFMYVGNNLSNSLSLYTVNRDGTLELTNADAVTFAAPSFPLDMQTTSNGKYLYTLSVGATETSIYVFQVNKSTGALSQIQVVNLGAPFAGQAGLSISDF